MSVKLAMVVVTAFLLATCASPPPPQGQAQNTGAADSAAANAVSKTFAAPVGDVRTAVLKSLLRMDVKVTVDRKTEQGWKIRGLADELVIVIELDTVNATTTRMRIIVAEGGKGWDERMIDIASRVLEAPANEWRLRAA